MSQDPAKPAGAERRRSFRHGPERAETFTHLRAVVEGYASQAGIRNISASGISLILDPWIEPETVVTVQLQHRGRMFSCRVPVRVVYLVERPDGDWILGGAFDRKLEGEELRALLC